MYMLSAFAEPRKPSLKSAMDRAEDQAKCSSEDIKLGSKDFQSSGCKVPLQPMGMMTRAWPKPLEKQAEAWVLSLPPYFGASSLFHSQQKPGSLSLGNCKEKNSTRSRIKLLDQNQKVKR